MPWYQYNGINPSNPNAFTLIGNTPPNCAGPKTYLCAIQAQDNSGQPIITLELTLEIANAVNNRTESTNVRLRPTP